VAWFDHQGSPVRVLETALSEKVDLATGDATLMAGELILGCLEGAVKLVRVQPAGKKEMSGADWFRGIRQEVISIL
jgi:methionyl-tRNA formyltransferase